MTTHNDSGNTSEQRKITETEQACINLLAHANGEIAGPATPGLAIFTPVGPTASRGAKLIGKGQELFGKGAVQLHVLSLRKRRMGPTTPGNEFDVALMSPDQNFKTTPNRGWGNWTSIAMIQYDSEESMNLALANAKATGEGVAVRDVKKFVQVIKDKANSATAKMTATAAEKTLKALTDLKEGQETRIKSAWANLPNRFDLDRCMILYAGSSSETKADGYWSNTNNTGRQSRAPGEVAYGGIGDISIPSDAITEVN
jgi:hypothetical protein